LARSPSTSTSRLPVRGAEQCRRRFTQPLQTNLGLDLKGGYSVTYQAQPITDPTTKAVSYPDSGAMSTIQGIIENRVNSTGTLEAVVETEGTDEILVEVPGAPTRRTSGISLASRGR